MREWEKIAIYTHISGFYQDSAQALYCVPPTSWSLKIHGFQIL